MSERNSGATKALAVKVRREGWLIFAIDPDEFWSDNLEGTVCDARDATWFRTREEAQERIDLRGIGRVYSIKHMAELVEA